MSDIFGRTSQVYGGGLSSDSMFMSFPALTGDGLGLLIQNIGLQYAQPIRRIFELGPGITNADGTRSQVVYYIVGRPEGNFSMARIVGFASLSQDFYSTFGNPCNPDPVFSLNSSGGCASSIETDAGIPSFGLTTWTLDGVLLQTVAMSATAQELIVGENVGGMFTSLTIDTGSLDPSAG